MTALDADADGQQECSIRTPQMSVLVDPAEGGSLTEWSLFQPPINLLDTLTRRPEPYHHKLRAKGNPVQAGAPAGGGPASIHDLIGVKEEGLASRLVYDDHRRTAFLDYGLAAMPTLHEVAHGTWAERRLWSGGVFRQAPRGRTAGRTRAGAPPHQQVWCGGASVDVWMVRQAPGGLIRKTVQVGLRSPTVRCTLALDGVEAPVVGVEFTLSLRDPDCLAEARAHQQLTQWALKEPEAGLALRLSIDPPATLMQVPIETVSESEEGLERTYQGLGVVCFWTVAATRAWTARMDWAVQRL